MSSYMNPCATVTVIAQNNLSTRKLVVLTAASSFRVVVTFGDPVRKQMPGFFHYVTNYLFSVSMGPHLGLPPPPSL